MSERTSEWPSTYSSFLVCSRPQCVSMTKTWIQYGVLNIHCHDIVNDEDDDDDDDDDDVED